MGSIVSKLFLDFWIFFIFTRSLSLYMLYVRGNNCDTDDAEYYVNHLMVAVLRELDGDTLLYYRSKPHHDGSVMTGCRRRDCLRKI